MQVKTLVSLLAVGTALAFASPASAQTMFNGAALSADDLPKVQARCDELANTAATESLAASNENEDTAENADTPADGNAATETTPQANAAADATTAIDLETVTLEMCTEAGLVAATP